MNHVPEEGPGAPSGGFSFLGPEPVLVSSEPCGWQDIELVEGHHPSWEARNQVSDAHYIALNLGAGRLSFERAELGRWRPAVMDPGTLWVNPAGTEFSHLVNRPCHFVALSLAPAWVEAFFHGQPRLELALGSEHPRASRRIRALWSLARQGKDATRLLAQTLAGEFLAELSGQPAWTRPLAPGDRRLRRAVDYLEAHFRGPIDLMSLSEVAGLSPFHFSRSFAKVIGMAPHQYLQELRLQEARRRMGSAAGSLAGLAAELGFSDQSHLTRHFKRRFGLAPGAYRKLLND